MMGQYFDPDRYVAVFENPAYPYREGVPKLAWLWTLLFGVFYLAFRRQWLHVGIMVGLLLTTVLVFPLLSFLIIPVVWIIYATQVRRLLIESYFRAGWQPVDIYAQEGIAI